MQSDFLPIILSINTIILTQLQDSNDEFIENKKFCPRQFALLDKIILVVL